MFEFVDAVTLGCVSGAGAGGAVVVVAVAGSVVLGLRLIVFFSLRLMDFIIVTTDLLSSCYNNGFYESADKQT